MNPSPKQRKKGDQLYIKTSNNLQTTPGNFNVTNIFYLRDLGGIHNGRQIGLISLVLLLVVPTHMPQQQVCQPDDLEGGKQDPTKKKKILLIIRKSRQLFTKTKTYRNIKKKGGLSIFKWVND